VNPDAPINEFRKGYSQNDALVTAQNNPYNKLEEEDGS